MDFCLEFRYEILPESIKTFGRYEGSYRQVGSQTDREISLNN
jgi:hypothetical protein